MDARDCEHGRQIGKCDACECEDLLLENARLRRELALADDNDREVRLAYAKARKERDEAFDVAMEQADLKGETLERVRRKGLVQGMREMQALIEKIDKENDSLRGLLGECAETIDRGCTTGHDLYQRIEAALKGGA